MNVIYKQVREISPRYRTIDKPEGPKILGPDRAADIVRELVGESNPQEHFVVLFVNGRHQVLEAQVISVGTLGQSLVHPREVFRHAVKISAGAILVAHNHPSGDPHPSSEDYGVTRRLVQAGKLLGIPVLDHVVVSRDNHWSFSAHGKLEEERAA